MPNQLVLIFSKADMQDLLNFSPDKIVVRSTIEEATLLGGAKAGVVKVYADAMQEGNPEPLATISGCPNPPCDEY